jgi:phospholipase C
VASAPQKLQRIEHIVVLQLENRSFDHMLGYLAHKGNELPAHGELDTTVDGLAGATNSYRGTAYGAEPLDEDAFDKQHLDPPHGDAEVKRQIAGGAMTGFLDVWAAKLHKKGGLMRSLKRAWAGKYRLDIDPEYDHFAYFDECTEVQPRTFLSDVLKDAQLPEVAWIDPNFAIRDMVKLIGPALDGPGSNDDHPPSRVIEAQRLVNKIYEALGRSDYWENTLLVVYYDEHGGFYDHVGPPEGMGPRIPAVVVGGRVKRGVCHDQFDHASLIKTILLRFGREGSIERMPARVAAASDLSSILRDDDEVVPFVPVANAGQAAIGDEDLEPVMLERGASRANRTVEILEDVLTDLQKLIVKHHALPLRTGRDKLSRLPTARLTALALRVAREKPMSERLPPRRP